MNTIARPLIEDRFLILSEDGKSIGILNKLGQNNYVVTTDGRKNSFNSQELKKVIDLADNCLNGKGDIMLKQEIQDKLLKVARTLNISWVEDAIHNACSIICPRSTNCPRPISCEKHPSSKKNFSWLSEIKEEIIKKGRRRK